MLLDVIVLESHETAVVQARVIEEVAAKYEIPRENIVFIVADNAAVNAATIDEINHLAAAARDRRNAATAAGDAAAAKAANDAYMAAKKWNVEYVRCRRTASTSRCLPFWGSSRISFA